jgi:uncharacterized protein
MLIRWVFMLAGTLALVLGVVGIFVPVLPTVPFLLLTAFCYAKASPRCHAWLINHKTLGPPIRRWNESKSISKRAKVAAILMIVISSTSSILFLLTTLWLKVLVALVCTSVIVFLVSLPTSKQ